MTLITVAQANKIDKLLDILIKNNNTGVVARDLIVPLFCSPDELTYLINTLKSEILHDNDIVFKCDDLRRIKSTGRINKLEFSFDNVILYKNYNTQRFINSGGCSNWLDEQIKEIKKTAKVFEKKEKRDKLDLDLRIAQLNEFSVKKWQFWLTLLIAVAGLVLSFISIILKSS